MKRRDFNKLAGLAIADLALGASLSGCATSPSKPVVQGTKKGRVVACQLKSRPGVSPVQLIDWDTHRYSEFEVPLELVHSVVQDRNDQQILYFFEVFGSAVKLNLSTGSIVKIDHKSGAGMFNGHGALSSSGELIACNEINPTTGSTVRLRSTKDFSIVSELPPECRTCHQIVSLPGSNLMATGNMGMGAGAITFYDVEKRKIVNRVAVDNPILHLIPISDHEVIGASFVDVKNTPLRRERIDKSNDSLTNLKMFADGTVVSPSPLIYVSADSNKKIFWDEHRTELFKLNFGLAKAKDGRLFSTHSNSNKVIVWRNFEIEKILDVPAPRNIQISDDGTELLVLSKGDLLLFSMTDYRPLAPLSQLRNISATSSYKA